MRSPGCRTGGFAMDVMSLAPAFCEVIRDRPDDRLRCQREAVVVEHRCHVVARHAELDGEQRAQLRVAILLHHEHRLVRFQEVGHRPVERERADAHVVHRQSLRAQQVHRLADRRVATAESRRSRSWRPPARRASGPGQGLRRVRELAREPVDDFLVRGRILGVRAELVVTGSAREPGALRSARPGSCAPRSRRRRRPGSASTCRSSPAPRRPAPFRGRDGSRRPTRGASPSSRSCRCRDRSRRTSASGSARRGRTPSRRA